MNGSQDYVLYDALNNIKRNGEFNGSIIIKCKNENIILSESVVIDDNNLILPEGLLIGLDNINNSKKEAISESSHYTLRLDENLIEYCLLVPKELIEKFDKERFSDAFPYTINLLHSACLFLNDNNFSINHLDFFKGEILKNPVALINRGICLADRVVIDDTGDPIFYDTLIIGRDSHDHISVSYEAFITVDDVLIKYIIILGIESLKGHI
ncbi:MAG: hypothetical protein GF317_17285 [Candidatus Lokiarchaeota archaeon]|nr:hypothetical protein [Candidatus Lokiarchaeota archaeon]MBD3201273.1 hypothetical protein [Candidatus Lokiarchaeota archaeon]